MTFTVIVPARLASRRLPNKPLADLGGVPMVVRVVERAKLSKAKRVVVAADSQAILEACARHGVEALMTSADHPSGSDRLAQACGLLGLADSEHVVNVQGDEPLIDPGLIDACAALLSQRPDCAMTTVAHPLLDAADFSNPNVVKVVLDAQQRALYFSRAPIPWWRDGSSAGSAAVEPSQAPLRHVGIYAYRVGFLKRFPTLAVAPLEIVEALEQLRALWHGERIAVHISDHAPMAGVDTPEDLARMRAHFAKPP